MRFEPALPKLYFERNNPAEIRAFFYDGHIPAGERSHTITLSWTGDAHWQPSRTERLGGPPANMWPSDVIGTRNAVLEGEIVGDTYQGDRQTEAAQAGLDGYYQSFDQKYLEFLRKAQPSSQQDAVR